MIVGSITFGNGLTGKIFSNDSITPVKKERAEKMTNKHYIGLIVVVVISYLVGVAFPSAGKPIVSKFGL